MRRVTRYGVIAVAASGAMAVTMPVAAAFAADGASAAEGAAAESPGLLSGNTVQLPVHVPVNVCGNTVNVVGLLNPAAGNSCANEDGGRKPGAASHGGASAEGRGKDSPGLASGNVVQLPVHLPVNVSGNSVNVVGVGNPATGNESVNGPDHPSRTTKPAPKPSTPSRAHPRPVPRAFVPHGGPEGSLAHTGADQTLVAAAGGTLLVLGGAVLYRRFRPQAVR
ncbi:chaplin [Streptomyces sp. AC550_RSS872]|uniref:chaplin n=1 Tax=Streptomyces sp. AC550_RSS872 TaxID=2823689 RepID=UPI001C27C816|nr:chaplin [Streptomyces sp. AC550_RSS872]